ncbi:class II histone deacetylase [Arthrobacter crystallopoietes]|uniref:class II histone deacetylase n=1 Tax=Crystallibacter crystallopoietes TaxID=37928 RepID=UPI001ABEBC20|nr:class II histone deacetylase [Arthrobacter crystallopoietes]QTG81708.1 class II histone deacetylase [Arthrobacter crystallopoietes]
MTTGWIWHEAFNWHNTGNGSGFFPPGGFIQPYESFDSPATKGRFAALVEVSGFDKQMRRLEATEVTDAEILRVHTPGYLLRLKELDATGGDAGENADFGPQGLRIARLAAGAVASAVRGVLAGEVSNAYALVRPAGHHAEPDRGRGYCILANTSIAAEIAREEFGIERIAIVDWDVHHGNGTQKVFWEDPNVLTVSLHQDQLYPVDSGFREENGGAGAEGSALNIPLPAGTGDGGYVRAVEQVVIPALQRFQPELIIVGSGMDAAVTDPLGRMMVTSEGFRRMSHLVIQAAAELADGNVVFAHEGGYSAHYVPFCGMAVLEELTGLKSAVDDPYHDFFQSYPQRLVEPWQEDAIRKAAVLAQFVPSYAVLQEASHTQNG